MNVVSRKLRFVTILGSLQAVTGAASFAALQWSGIKSA